MTRAQWSITARAARSPKKGIYSWNNGIHVFIYKRHVAQEKLTPKKSCNQTLHFELHDMFSLCLCLTLKLPDIAIATLCMLMMLCKFSVSFLSWTITTILMTMVQIDEKGFRSPVSLHQQGFRGKESVRLELWDSVFGRCGCLFPASSSLDYLLSPLTQKSKVNRGSCRSEDLCIPPRAWPVSLLHGHHVKMMSQYVVSESDIISYFLSFVV